MNPFIQNMLSLVGNRDWGAALHPGGRGHVGLGMRFGGRTPMVRGGGQPAPGMGISGGTGIVQPSPFQLGLGSVGLGRPGFRGARPTPSSGGGPSLAPNARRVGGGVLGGFSGLR